MRVYVGGKYGKVRRRIPWYPFIISSAYNTRIHIVNSKWLASPDEHEQENGEKGLTSPENNVQLYAAKKKKGTPHYTHYTHYDLVYNYCRCCCWCRVQIGNTASTLRINSGAGFSCCCCWCWSRVRMLPYINTRS